MKRSDWSKPSLARAIHPRVLEFIITLYVVGCAFLFIAAVVLQLDKWGI